MPRESLSSAALAAMNAQQTGDAFLVRMTIEAEGMDTIRIINNNEDLGGFIAFPFDISLPGQDPGSPTKATVIIDNVDQRIAQAIRSITSAPTVTLEVVLASSPGTVEVSFPGLTMRSVEFTSDQIRAELVFEQIYVEPITLNMVPSRFPGLF